MTVDELFMKRCIELGEIGLRNAMPNPSVGCVVVHNNKIIAEGHTSKFGGPHAEVNAIDSIENKAIVSESTIYVSLEPCSHTGKTPPCADLLVKHLPKRVVIGCLDPNPLVNGQGLKKLQEAGINCTIDVLKEACLKANSRFFTYQTKKRPYIILKWAQTQDGFLDKKRTTELGPNWITQPETKALTHKWRAEEQAILVGTRTAIVDNPSLTTRHYPGPNPTRILIDKALKVKPSSNAFNTEAKTIVLNQVKSSENGNLKFIKLNDFSSKIICDTLFEENISSIIVEGGATTLNSFIEANLWDEARVLVGKTIFESGLAAPKLAIDPNNSLSFGKDIIHTYIND